LIVALATIVCRVSEANRILSRQTFINYWRTKLPNRSIVPFVASANARPSLDQARLAERLGA